MFVVLYDRETKKYARSPAGVLERFAFCFRLAHSSSMSAHMATMKKSYSGVSRSDLMRRDMARKRKAKRMRAEGEVKEKELVATGVRTAAGMGMGWLFASYPGAAQIAIPGSEGRGIDTRLLVAAGTKTLVLAGYLKGETAARVSEIGDAAAVLFGHDLAVNFVNKNQ